MIPAQDQLADLISDALMGQLSKHETPRVITIVCKGPNRFDIHEGEHFVDRLCWEEMIGHVAVMTCQFVADNQRQRGLFGMTDVDRYQRARDWNSPLGSSRSLRALDEATFQQRVSEWREERYGVRLLACEVRVGL